MGSFFSVDSAFWTDADVVDNFTPEDKYFYLYLLTSPHGNISGCFEVSIKQIAVETGYSCDTIERLIERFTSYHKMIDYNSENKEVLIHKWGKHHWTKSDKYVAALRKKINAVKTLKFKDFLLASLGCLLDENEDDDTVWIPYVYGMDTSLSFPLSYPLSFNNSLEKQDNKEEGNIKSRGTDYQKIVDLYNTTCVSFPRLTRLSEKRKEAIRARLKEYSDGDFKILFEKAEASKFLKGGNDRNWSATFDWLIKDSNMAKVLDGNYDNRGGAGSGRGSGTMDGGSSEERWHLRADVT